jgi:hypothetical protein
VPEAAVNENSGPVARQDDIGPARQIAPVQPKAESKPVECRTNGALRSRVARSDARHVPASTFRRQSVHWSIEKENVPHNLRNLAGEERRNRVPDLAVLIRSCAFEKVVVRKRLEPSGFADGEAPALKRVWMNEIVPVLGDVRGNSCCRHRTALDAKAIVKEAVRQRLLYVFMTRQKRRWKISELRRDAMNRRVTGRKEITVKIFFDVTTRLVVAHTSNALIAIPFSLLARCPELRFYK